jgi:hypothetical protein
MAEYNPPAAMNQRLNEAVGRILKKASVRRMVRPRWSDFG